MAEQKCYAVITGMVNPLRAKSRKAARFMKKQSGFVGIYPTDGYTAWVYKSRNDAVGAMNMANSVGIQTGNEVVECYIDLEAMNEEP